VIARFRREVGENCALLRYDPEERSYQAAITSREEKINYHFWYDKIMVFSGLIITVETKNLHSGYVM
jgi:hypothetical protein